MPISDIEIRQFVGRLESLDDIIRTQSAIHAAWNLISTIAAHEFSVGNKVSFKGKRGEIVIGVVLRINKTSITIRDSRTCMIWKVSPGLVQKIV